MRNGKLKLAGFFSAKLRGRQISWLPCEIEALSIAAAIRHFSPYIVQSVHNTSILTDSKPCVQAHEKLCRGEFSVSLRVSTFLSVDTRQLFAISQERKARLPFTSRSKWLGIQADCQDLRRTHLHLIQGTRPSKKVTNAKDVK